MSFFKNPLQKKYVPALIAIVVGVMCTAVDHGSHRIVPILVWTYMTWSAVTGADQPLRTFPFWLYVAMGSLFGAFAALMLFSGAFLAAGFAGIIAAFPISIVFTRQREEQTNVQ